MEDEGEDRILATYRGNYETGPDNGEIRSK